MGLQALQALEAEGDEHDEAEEAHQRHRPGDNEEDAEPTNYAPEPGLEPLLSGGRATNDELAVGRPHELAVAQPRRVAVHLCGVAAPVFALGDDLELVQVIDVRHPSMMSLLTAACHPGRRGPVDRAPPGDPGPRGR